MSDRTSFGKLHAENELKSAFSGDSMHNVVDEKSLIIKDSLTATTMAETILFGIYGKDNITQQRPYEIYSINNHWIINGTLPKDSKGGTFLIIFDATNGRILRITHGK